MRAQTGGLKDAAYIEAGGNGLMGSIGYEHIFKGKLASRIGVFYYEHAFLLPVSLSVIYGPGKHHLETGGGLTFARYSNLLNARTGKIETTQPLNIIGLIGYRFQPPQSRLFFRTAFTPVFVVSTTNAFVPWMGIGCGLRF